jgi:KaiC/GvpD/RAD55 family RecA-like ATPase
VLVFSTKQRLAKRWARRSSDIVETVVQLVQGAHEAIECLTKGHLDGLGYCMSAYWERKKVMAGPESYICEALFREKSILDLILSQVCIEGGTLCGTGGEH